MRGFSFSILLLLPSLLCACKQDYGLGEPCVPEAIPCDQDGKNCGFSRTETYLETDSASCEARACVVHKLDNGTQDQIPADPRVICEQDSSEGCVPQANLEQAVHCTCRCDGPKGASNRCLCPDDFVCMQVSTSPAGSSAAMYCVKPL